MLTQYDRSAVLWRRWLETLTITMVAPLLGMAVDRSDPFLIQAAFPWLVLVPLLCGAQHGLLAGLVSNAMLCVLIVGNALRGPGMPVGFASWFGGCLMIAAIAGQLRDVALRRAASLVQQGEQLAQQLERAQRSRAVLKLSHARLQERLAAERWSLEAALEAAAKRMLLTAAPRELSEVVLDVLANQALVHAASLYGVHADGTLSGLPVASLGGCPLSTEPHPLVERCAAQKRLVAVVDPDAPGAEADRSVLVAVPLITSGQRLIGVIAVHQMPFLAFQTEQLQNLLLLASQLTDLLADRLTGALGEHTQPAPRPRLSATQVLPAPPPLGRARAQTLGAPAPARERDRHPYEVVSDGFAEVSVSTNWEPAG